MNNTQFNNSFSFLNKNMSKSISFIVLVVALFLFAVPINASSVEINIHISYPSHHNPINPVTQTLHDHDSIVNHEILPIEQQSDEAEVDEASDSEIVGSNVPNSNSAESLHINSPGNRKDHTVTSYGKWNINGDLTGESSLNTWGGLNENVHISTQMVDSNNSSSSINEAIDNGLCVSFKCSLLPAGTVIEIVACALPLFFTSLIAYWIFYKSGWKFARLNYLVATYSNSLLNSRDPFQFERYVNLTNTICLSLALYVLNTLTLNFWFCHFSGK